MRSQGAAAAAARDRTRAHLAIIGAAFFFGASFVAVKRSVEDMTPVAFLALRFAIGAAVLAPVAWRQAVRPRLWGVGSGLGAVLLAGYLFQTIGLRHTTTSNSAFITGLFVVCTPLWAAVLFRRRPSAPTVAGIVLATPGLFLLTGAHLSLRTGDALTLGCAVTFGLHVALLGRYCPDHPPLALNALQLAVVSAGCLVATPFTGVGAVTGRAVLGALFTGVLVSAVGISLQMYGQRLVGPSRTALLLVLEPVFAGAVGYGIGERLGPGAWAGAALILVGIVAAESAPWWSRAGRGTRALS